MRTVPGRDGHDQPVDDARETTLLMHERWVVQEEHGMDDAWRAGREGAVSDSSNARAKHRPSATQREKQTKRATVQFSMEWQKEAA